MNGHKALFPEIEELVSVEKALTEKLIQVRRDQDGRSATANPLSETWLKTLQQMQFHQPEELETLMDWVIEALAKGGVQMTHPGYLGLFNPSPTFAAECADRIAAAFNPQVCVYSHAPAAVEIELHVIRELALRAGLPSGSGGHFTSGGAEANLTATLCALQRKCPDCSEQGLWAFGGRAVLYVSIESHLAWLKIAQATGIGRDAVRLVATDGAGRMCMQALGSAIEDDLRAGHVPFMIAATAGTTNAGMIDPLHLSAEMARQNELWFHVDAAWGGALIASEHYRSALDGMEKADSITIDAHKWFATTMGAGMFLLRDPDVLAQAFRVAASYMPDSESGKDFYVNSNQWSRRFVGLRLFLSLGTAGWAGYGQHIEWTLRLADRLATGLEQMGWTKVNESKVGVVCMLPPEGHDAVDTYVKLANGDGRFWISKAIFEGRPVLRACVTNGRTTETVIDNLIGVLTQPAPTP